MRYEDERYVRLYTRDTTTWLLMPWQSRALLPLILRKVDRAGLIELGPEGADALAIVVGLPLEVVEVGLRGALDRGVVEMHGTTLVWPKYIEAQEIRQSDAHRKREQRERERARVRASSNPPELPNCHTESHGVTNGHTESQDVTPSRADPIRAEPSQPREVADAGAPPAPLDDRPARRAAKRSTSKRAEPTYDPTGETATAIAWRVWRATYQASKRRYDRYVDGIGDGERIARIAKHAVGLLDGMPPEGPPGLALERILGHWFREYLRDDGARNFLAEQRHALQFFERGIPTYGLPRPSKPPVATAPPADRDLKPANLIPLPPDALAALQNLGAVGGGPLTRSAPVADLEARQRELRRQADALVSGDASDSDRAEAS